MRCCRDFDKQKRRCYQRRSGAPQRDGEDRESPDHGEYYGRAASGVSSPDSRSIFEDVDD